MVISENRRSFRHALSITEALNRIFNFDDPDSTLSEVLVLAMESAEREYNQAVKTGASNKEQQKLKLQLNKAKLEYQRARAMRLELETAADEFAQWLYHPHLVVSTRKYYSEESHFTKNSLYHWAKKTRGIEIPEWKLTTQQEPEWKVWEHADPGSELSEGQKLFLAIAWVLDRLLSETDGNWRDRLGATTDRTRSRYIVDGEFDKNKLVNKVVKEIPVPPNGSKPNRTVGDNLSLVYSFMSDQEATVTELSPKQMPMAHRTLFALARATWSTLTGGHCPTPDTYDYPNDMEATLANGLQDDEPFTPKELKQCLTAARAEVVKQNQP